MRTKRRQGQVYDSPCAEVQHGREPESTLLPERALGVRGAVTYLGGARAEGYSELRQSLERATPIMAVVFS